MDPRRRMEEKADRIQSSQVPFIEKYTDIALVEQPLGKPVECEVIVIRIHKSLLKFYSFSLVAFILMGVVMFFTT